MKKGVRRQSGRVLVEQQVFVKRKGSFVLRGFGIVRALAALAAASGSLALGACSNSSAPAAPFQTATATPTQTGQVRAVHGSPDAGPVDIYVYTGSSRPSTPTVAGATYPQITGYLTVPAGTYTIDVLAPAGTASTTTPVASEQVSVSAGAQYSVVVGGKVAKKTLQFVNFVEPAETAGQSAVIVHHASPFVQSLVAPVGVGIYNVATAGGKPPAASATTQLFSFSLAAASGPAASGSVSGGEFFLSPLPSSGLPAAIGFAAGAPGTTHLASVAVSATPSQLASVLTQQTAAQKALAADTSSAFPAGAHLSVFAIDTASAAELIGTLDP